jgi:Family of unknown function (DUF6491)
MIGRTLIAAALLAAAPASAKQNTPSGETVIPRISAFLDWRPDGSQALLIQADTGRWYRATLQAPCPRMLNRAAMRFLGSPGNRFDRFSAINAAGWRCQVASVTRAEPPRRR